MIKLSDLVQPIDINSVDFTDRLVLASDVLSHLLYVQIETNRRLPGKWSMRDVYGTVATDLLSIAGITITKDDNSFHSNMIQ